jgi:RND superfamily putative drug exporter
MNKVRGIISLPAGRRAKWIVLAGWLIVVAVAGPLAGKLSSAEQNDAKSWLPATAESTRVLDLQSRVQPPNVYPAVVIYDRPSGITAADRAQAAADIDRFAGLSGVQRSQIAGPAVSKDGKAIQAIVSVDLGKDGWDKAAAAADSLRAIADAGADGMSVHIAGPLGTAADSSDAFSGLDSTLLLAALSVVIVLLLLTYRSPVLWLLPVMSAGVALVGSQAVIYLLARHAGLTVNAQSAGILSVLVFGVGTDYALLLTARYREELRRHADRHEAMAIALRRAGPAILASAGTVILAMLALVIAELNSTSGMGPVLAIGVGVALLAMLTLLPALLVSCGRWVFWPARPVFGSPEPTARGGWARVGRAIAVRPRLTWVTTALVLGVMALGLTGLKASGLSNADSFRGTPDSVAGERVLARHFPAGAWQPVVVAGNVGTGPQLAAAFRDVPGITGVTGPKVVAGHAYLEGTLTAPADSGAAADTVNAVRNAVHTVPGADAMVGGNTAINLDVQNAAAHDRGVIIPLILAVVLVILGALLRALVAPLILLATVVLSFAAALGVSALLFVFVFLVALGIDYNIFLMTRVREEAARNGPRRGALTGLAVTGSVITSAGAVLAGTFAVLGTLPVTFLTEIGFAVAFGVLLDTIVVRSVLVTALNLDVGRWMWWPGKLARETARPGLELEATGDRVRAYARGSSALDENAGIEQGGEDQPQAFGGTRV